MKSKSPPESSPTPNSPNSKIKALPVWAKVSLMAMLVFFASIGIFQSEFESHENFPDISVEDQKIAEEDESDGGASAFEEIGVRKQIKELKLIRDDGTIGKISDFKGKVVILSFWATWCVPCLVELPTFAKLEKEFSSEGLVVVPVNVEDDTVDRQFIASLWQKHSIGFPTFYDPQQISSNIMDVQIMPTNYVIDRKGRIAFASYGANNWAGTKARKFITALLAEKD
ncbi:MAG: TlpA disulfide reductase family protein [Pseudomonadota bacterium]|nr:TlpA disulfide reductase family protein [Pseudomonadota bacterium]